MRRALAIAGSIVFFFLAPGIVAFLVPWLIVQFGASPLWPDLQWTRWPGLVLAALGLAALVECFARFALQGEGTPAPVAPTRYLVVDGLYRHVRNPMYVSVLAIVLGWAVSFTSASLFAYAALVWLCFNIFVSVYEEPALTATFGKQYENYRANVGRWVPRLSPWTPEI